MRPTPIRQTRPARRGLARLAGAVVAVAAAPTAAHAWGDEGHEIVASIAARYLTAAAAAKVNALLAADPDRLTAPDLLSRATWADAYRSAGHRETASWHYVDLELDHPDLKAACDGFPPPAHPASAGPARDCVVDRINAFAAELANPATPQPERILALKFVLHLVGDVHQPLHASDNHDRGGNCLRLSLGGPRTTNLHHYWDDTVVEALGTDPRAVAGRLRARITPAEASAWRQGDPASWAMDTYRVSKAVAYWSGARPGCDRDAAPVSLPTGYEARAEAAAAVQLEKAGVRLGAVLNRSLGT